MLSFVHGFTRGARYPLLGAGFIRQQRLARYCVGIVLANIVIFASVVALGVMLARRLTDRLAALPFVLEHPSLLVLAWLIAGALVVGVASLIVVLAARAIAAPFLDALSERVEALVTQRRPEPAGVSRTMRALGIGVIDAICGLTLALVVSGGLTLTALVPFVGPPVATAVGGLFACLFIAQELVGLAMARRFVSYRGRWRWVMRHAPECLGFGTTTLVLLLVPGIGFVTLATAAAGGTLLYLDTSQHE